MIIVLLVPIVLLVVLFVVVDNLEQFLGLALVVGALEFVAALIYSMRQNRRRRARR